MNEIQNQIKALSTQAAQLSRAATDAFQAKNLRLGRELMAQAVSASKNCQQLIQEYTQLKSAAKKSN